MRKKTLKRGRKSKEDKLQEKYEELQKDFVKLNEDNQRQISRLWNRLDNEISAQSELHSTIHNLNVVISALGDRIYLLQKQNSGIIENRNQYATNLVSTRNNFSDQERTTY